MKYLLIICALIWSSSALAANNDRDFDRFVEGALEVYSQFKTPSKEESERFYAFLQTKWNTSVCAKNCGQVGYHIGQQYAREKNIEIKQNRGVQLLRTGT